MSKVDYLKIEKQSRMLLIAKECSILPVFNNPLVPFTAAVVPFLRDDWERE